MYESAIVIGMILGTTLTIPNLAPLLSPAIIDKVSYNLLFAVGFGVAVALITYGMRLDMAERLNIQPRPILWHVGFTVFGSLIASGIGLGIRWMSRATSKSKG